MITKLAKITLYILFIAIIGSTSVAPAFAADSDWLTGDAQRDETNLFLIYSQEQDEQEQDNYSNFENIKRIMARQGFEDVVEELRAQGWEEWQIDEYIDELDKTRDAGLAFNNRAAKLPQNAGLLEKEQIEGLRSYYDSLSEAEKSYVEESAYRRLVKAEERLANPTLEERIRELLSKSDKDTVTTLAVIGLVILWEILFLIQSFMAYGSAYRKTKLGGDNGVSLFGWMIAYGLAAIIPFLGIALWRRSKKKENANKVDIEPESQNEQPSIESDQKASVADQPDTEQFD